MRRSPKFMLPKLHIQKGVALLLMVLLTLIAYPSYAQSFPRIHERAESVTQPIRAGDDVSPLKPRRAGVSPAPASISIDPVLQEKRSAETANVAPPGTPHRIGFGRDVPQLGSIADTAAHLQWRHTPQYGNIAAISITSPQAVGIRLGILVRRLPAEATVRFYAQGAEAAYKISGKEIMESIKRNLDAGDGGDAALTYWSPHIEGEEATLEIELPPGVSPDTVEISIPRVSHFFSSPLAAQGGNIIKSIGDAASCEIDATCYSAWSPESNATAKMSFVGADGNSYLCTGTLLSDMTSSRTPYFLSANHCISKQTVASTLQTYWFYRSASCNSGTLNPGNKTLTGGATLLYASSVTDTSFLMLNNTPPAGAMYAGWDSNAPALGTAVTGVHHAKGDLQKISFGSIQSFMDCTGDPGLSSFTCATSTQSTAEYLDITFTSGITEGGSSGSGLFKTSGSSHYLIAQLYGGSSRCSDQNGRDAYGRFDVAYNAALHQWLSAGSALYFPHVATSIPWQTEIAIINTSLNQTVTGALMAFSDDGQLVGTKEVTLSARGRRQITVASEFTNHTNIGYIIFDADSDTVQGYTKFYQEGTYRAAIPAVKEVNTSVIYITHIASDARWWTGISLVNTTSTAKQLTITFNAGQSRQFTLNANEHRTFNILELFNNQPQPDIKSAVITNASGIIGLELFGSIGGGNQLDGILLTDKTASILYYPHVASDNVWWTGIVAYNPSQSSCTITITPYSAQGTPLSPSTLSIAGKEKYIGVVSNLGLPAQTAWFRIDSTLPLSGFELFGAVDGNQLAAYSGSGGTATKAGVFAKIEKNGWTGIAFVNTEAGAASVTLTAYNDNGTAVATQVLPVGGYAKVVNFAEDIFSQDISGATYISYSSDRNVVGFQLNGSADGTMLDGLPGLDTEPPPGTGMVIIPAGSFQMGDGIDGMSSAMPVHTVTVSAFYLDKYEVTKALWDEVKTWATANGYAFDNAGAGTAATHPVQTVSWHDVIKWLNARSEKEGRTPVYYTDSDQAMVYRTEQVNVAAGAVKWSANGYRLPTEAEWEYAARTGTTTRYYTGNCISTDQANYNGNFPWTGCPAGQYRGGTTVVGSFAANPWGLYDMAGNVWEWTWDWSGAYSSIAATNPRGPDSGSYRVFRGGSWYDRVAGNLRSAVRSYGTPTSKGSSLGFRSALSQP